MSCSVVSIESIGSTQVNYQISTIVSLQSINDEKIFHNFPQSFPNLDQQSLSCINLDTSTIEKTGECILVSWIKTDSYLSNSFLHTKCTDSMKTDLVNINIVDIVGSEFCVVTGDGKKLYNEIFHNMIKKKRVIISFNGVEFLTPAFLNVSICQLYGQFEEDIINQYLVVSNMTEEDKKILSILVTKAKLYFKNSSIYDKLHNVSFGEGYE